MEPTVSVSLGVARSLPSKLETLLSNHRLWLRKEEKSTIGLLKEELQELIDKYLTEPSEAYAAASTARCWMKEVRELCYDIDDFLDELLHGLQAAAAAPTNLRGKIARLRVGLSRSRWVTSQSSGFRSRLGEAIKRHNRYSLNMRQGQPTRINSDESPIPLPHGFETRRLVGIDSSIEKLTEWLTGDGERQLRVVSIVGLGGVGKTTLANELYCKLGSKFVCRAFARSSQEPDMRRLLSSILLQVRRHQLPNDVELRNLIDTIREHLRHKKYFIIIDDLWASSTWDIVRSALPDDKCCSRVLVTTEIDVISQRCCVKSEHIFTMKPLSYKGSSELFFSRLVGKVSENCEELDRVSSEIIRNCGGFPLATIATASLFARQHDKMEDCNCIRRTLSYNLGTNPTIEGMKQVLSLCYNNLPDRLKACMLYLSIYKEDHIICKDDLVNEWITEGFICAKQGEHMEEVAGSYFDELVNAGMVLPIDTNNYNGKVLSCTVHYIVLNLIRYRSIYENFVTAITHSQTNTRLADKVRRLALHFGDAGDAEPPAKLRLSQVRSLIFFGTFKCLPSITDFLNLRVLILRIWGDQHNVSLDFTTVCKLFRLRSLKIECNVTLNLQTQLQGLEHLKILKIDSRVTEVPQDIVHLSGLLHLRLPGNINLPSGIGHLASLQTLGCFDLSSNSAENVLSLGNLSHMRDLHLTCSTIPCDNLEENVGCLASVLSKLGNLRSVNLSPGVFTNANTSEASSSRNNNISWDGLSNVSSPPVLLEKLELSPRNCIFSRLPMWIGQLGNIAVIKIATRELRQSDMDVLNRLNSLSSLSLYVRTTPAERIVVDKEGFPLLKYFKFVCSGLCLGFKKEMMPNVRRIQLGFSANTLEQFSLVDAGFENLTGLEVFSAKIGRSGSDMSVRNAVQSALKDVFSKRGSCPTINIQLVDMIFHGEMNVVDPEKPHTIATGPSEEQSKNTEKGSMEEQNIHGDSSTGRHQHQGQSRHKDLRMKAQGTHIMDPDAKELYHISRSLKKEIVLLRKKVADASIKEQRLLSEKLILERILVDLRMAIDEMQDEALRGYVKKLSHKEKHVEKQKRLAGELQVLEEEVNLFTSSLVSMLAEYNVHIPQANASTITTATKRLYQQMRWKIRIPNGNYIEENATTSDKELHGHGDPLPGIHSFQIVGEPKPGFTLKAFGSPTNGTTIYNFQWVRYLDDGTRLRIKDASLCDYMVTTEDVGFRLAVDCTPEDKNHRKGNLVRQFANNGRKITCGDPLPGIGSFQIVGEPRPGHTLRACGFPTNGTTLCSFQWVRYLTIGGKGGTGRPIQGATIYDYVVTAHDVGTILAVECTPHDSNDRKGNLVTEFANNGCKITCDPDMQNQIKLYRTIGKADFDVYFLEYSSKQRRVTIRLRELGYQVKFKHTSKVLIDEKYSPNLQAKIPHGHSTQFILVGSGGVNLLFDTHRITETQYYDIRLRDLIVLVLRTFKKKGFVMGLLPQLNSAAAATGVRAAAATSG